MGLAAPAMAQDVNYKDMLKPIETTLKAGNADPKALVALGNLLAMNKNYDQANAVADAVIAKFKNYGDAYILKGASMQCRTMVVRLLHGMVSV